MDIKNFENKVQEMQLAFQVAKQRYEELCDVVIEEKTKEWMKGASTKNRDVGVMVNALTQLKVSGNHDCTDSMVLMVVDDMIKETGPLKRIMDGAREDVNQAIADLERVTNEVLHGIFAQLVDVKGNSTDVCGPVETLSVETVGELNVNLRKFMEFQLLKRSSIDAVLNRNTNHEANSDMQRLLELESVLSKLVPNEELVLKRKRLTELNDGNIQEAVQTWCENNLLALYYYGHISSWDVSKVTNMTSLFQGKSAFNDDISTWDVSNVMSMQQMFQNATSFNQPLNSWNVSNVTNMQYMFQNALVFNQPLNSWNVSNVTSMNFLFYSAVEFNQPLNSWSVSNVTYTNCMFHGAAAFNQPVDSWDVSNVTNMHGMFYGAFVFNQPLNSWNVSNVTSMLGMFNGAAAFNQPLNSWNVSNVIDMRNMFQYAAAFNQPLNRWNVSNGIDKSNMFHGAKAFIDSQSLNGWL